MRIHYITTKGALPVTKVCMTAFKVCKSIKRVYLPIYRVNLRMIEKGQRPWNNRKTLSTWH